MKIIAEQIVGNKSIFELDPYVTDLLTRVMGRVYYDLAKSEYIDLAKELHDYQIRVADESTYVHMKLARTSMYDDDSKFDKETGRRIDFTPVVYTAPEVPEYLRGFISEYVIMDVRHHQEPIEDTEKSVSTSEPVNPVIKDPSLFNLENYSDDDSMVSEKSEVSADLDGKSEMDQNPTDREEKLELVPMALKFVSNYDLNTDVRDMSLSSLTGFINDMMLAKSLTEFGQMVGKAPGSIVSKMETASKILTENEVSFRYIPRKSTTDIVEYRGNFVKYAGSDDDRIRRLSKMHIKCI